MSVRTAVIRSSLTALQCVQFEVLVRQMRAMEGLEKQEYRDTTYWDRGYQFAAGRKTINQARHPNGETECVPARPSRAHHATAANNVNMFVCGPNVIYMFYPTYRNAGVEVGARSVSHTGTQAKLDGTNDRSREDPGYCATTNICNDSESRQSRPQCWPRS